MVLNTVHEADAPADIRRLRTHFIQAEDTDAILLSGGRSGPSPRDGPYCTGAYVTRRSRLRDGIPRSGALLHGQHRYYMIEKKAGIVAHRAQTPSRLRRGPSPADG